jgi:hypothetical protein
MEFALIRDDIFDHKYVFVELMLNRGEVVDHIAQADEEIDRVLRSKMEMEKA